MLTCGCSTKLASAATVALLIGGLVAEAQTAAAAAGSSNAFASAAASAQSISDCLAGNHAAVGTRPEVS